MELPETPRSHVDVEIGLHRFRPESYQVVIRHSDPSSHVIRDPVWGEAPIDHTGLLVEPPDFKLKGYGAALSKQLFHDNKVEGAFRDAKREAERKGQTLRIRLFIDRSAQELHDLRWELLVDPITGDYWTTSDWILFSRFISSSDWRPVKLRRKSELTALIAVANPTDLADRGWAVVDVKGEIERAQNALGDIPAQVAGDRLNEPLTLNRLLKHLRESPDVVYLACHGMLTRSGEPYLILQDDEGKMARVKGTDLAERIRELAEPPRLVVLASCESAGTARATGSPDERPIAQSAVAPRLADAGVPAIVAMQGKITMPTVKKMMGELFGELAKDGQIDRAMSVARGEVRDCDDSWMPALFLRLTNGRIWYEPGFAGNTDEFKKWEAICKSVGSGDFVPILGPDFGEGIFGASSERATKLAKDQGFPMARHDHTDLAKVSQFLSIRHDRSTALELVRENFGKQLRQTVAHRLPESQRQGSSKELIQRLALALRNDPEDPFTILASLPAKLYVNAEQDRLLFEAIRGVELPGENGPDERKPERLAFPWRSTNNFHPIKPEFSEPTANSPLVYQVFGDVRDPDSLVVTEDDFFDYLIEMHSHKLMPTVVSGLLTRSSLLFLGFRMTDWTFRVLFRMIMNFKGIYEAGARSHVGVQIDPDDTDFADVERARQYLADYFGAANRAGRPELPVEIYWGTARDFLIELRKRLEARKAPEEAGSYAAVADEW